MIQPDANDLPDLVRELHRTRTPWLPCGLGSRLGWGAPLRQPCIPLSCASLSGIVEHNPGDFTLSVQAGTSLLEVQQHLAQHRQWLAVDWPWGCGEPPEPQAGGSIGGLVARGLAGGYRQRHLGIRDQLIGLALLRVDGVAARAGGRVVKNVAGYDLMRLFCGSWGSLGLITELTLRTQPLPPARGGLLVQGDPAELEPLVRWLLSSGLTPERLDWWSAPLAAAAGLEPRPALLIALASVSPASLQEQSRTIQQRTQLPWRSLDAEALPALLAAGRGRFQPSSARAGSHAAGAADPMAGPSGEASDSGGPTTPWLLRVGLRSDRIATFLEQPELTGLAVELAAGSGIGQLWETDWETDADPSAGLTPARVQALRRHCQAQGGWLTVLQQPQGSALEAWLDAPARLQIEAVKRRFDPQGQLAPGRLPGVAHGLPPQPDRP